MKVLYYEKKPYKELTFEEATALTNVLTGKSKPTHYEVANDVLKTSLMEIREKIEEEQEVAKKPCNMATDDIKSELKNFEELYKNHDTGKRVYDNNLFFGEREGIIEWIISQVIIVRTDFYGDNHCMIKDLVRWRNYERKAELLQELQSRRCSAEQKERSEQIGADNNEAKKVLEGKLNDIRGNLYKDRKYEKTFREIEIEVGERQPEYTD